MLKENKHFTVEREFPFFYLHPVSLERGIVSFINYNHPPYFEKVPLANTRTLTYCLPFKKKIQKIITE